METFNPGAVVLQCGADSLSVDTLGCFIFSIKAYAECIRYMRSFNVQLLLVGDGGYTIRRVARWCYETGVALGVEVDDKTPPHEYYKYFGPDYTLHVAPSNMENKNSNQFLDEIRTMLSRTSFKNMLPAFSFRNVYLREKSPEEDEDQEDPDTRYEEYDSDMES